jgi:hypothetical protein
MLNRYECDFQNSLDHDLTPQLRSELYIKLGIPTYGQGNSDAYNYFIGIRSRGFFELPDKIQIIGDFLKPFPKPYNAFVTLLREDYKIIFPFPKKESDAIVITNNPALRDILLDNLSRVVLVGNGFVSTTIEMYNIFRENRDSNIYYLGTCLGTQYANIINANKTELPNGEISYFHGKTDDTNPSRVIMSSRNLDDAFQMLVLGERWDLCIDDGSSYIFNCMSTIFDQRQTPQPPMVVNTSLVDKNTCYSENCALFNSFFPGQNYDEKTLDEINETSLDYILKRTVQHVHTLYK